MNSLSLRALLASGAASALLLSAGLVQAAPHNTDSWPQAHADVAPDAAVRFGRLANGMRYAILHNATPKGQVAVRLRIASGSFEESDADQGLAHFLEHMAFKGSTHVPAGEMLNILERKGLAFGPDTNAFTAQEQTVYMLDLPEADADTVDTGLKLMRETASELTIDPAAVQSERGVVLSEERLRATPADAAVRAQVHFLLEGQRATGRWPIGQVEVIQNAPASAIRAFYQANYRPERATLLVIGDIDPAAIEAKIRAGFGDWKGVGAPVSEPDLGQVAHRGVAAKVVVNPGAGTSLQLAFVRPFDDTADSQAKRKRDQIESLAFAVVNRRLERLARGANPPFLAAGAADQNVLASADLGELNVITAPGKWREGLAAAETVRRQAVQFGVRQDEVDREIVDLRTALQNAAKGENTRKSTDIATGFIQAVNDDDVITNPSQDLALFEAEVKGLTASDVSQALRHDFSGQGPLVMLTSPTPVEGGDATVKAAFTEVEAQPITAEVAQAVKTWPYTHFGKPGEVVERRRDAGLDVTFVRFRNGVRLTVKPTSFAKDQILVTARVGHGMLDLSPTHGAATWSLSALVQGGTKDLTLEEEQRALSGALVNHGLGLGEDAFELSGSTRPADFAIELQLLTADVTAPGFRPEAFNRVRASYLQALDQLQATPQGVVAESLGQLIHSGDTRWHFPVRAELEAARPDELPALLARPLAEGPIEVVVVGDVTVDEAIRQTAATFGALPPRPAPTAPPASATTLRFPSPLTVPINLLHKGRQDQGMAMIAWPTVDAMSDTAEFRRVDLAGEVLKLRLIDELRISQGATYSPDIATDGSRVFPGYGYTYAAVEIPPAKMKGFFETTSSTVRDMATKGVTADELERARKPVLEQVAKQQQTNEYWRLVLGGAALDPRRLDRIRTTQAQLQAVTTEDVRAAAAKYLNDGRAWRLTVTPEPTQAPTATPAPTGK